MCGSGIGTFIFAPLTEYLLEHHGWRMTLLIQAGKTICIFLDFTQNYLYPINKIVKNNIYNKRIFYAYFVIKRHYIVMCAIGNNVPTSGANYHNKRD